ncbi:hypothetical protein [Desulfogranum marinum]|jgi:hypothetical protein|uniref:hypothetical protein n=1 Tax=Desulfogranum marinum TaxID=453220 RepID=UPI0029C8F060|nr:hypothetical protein [Desulfogranum marinum]
MRNPLIIERVRTISGSFAFIEHRFLRHGFWSSLSHQELLLYFFLVMVADRQGLSFYSYDKICTLLTINVDEYILARDGLLSKNLLAFDGTLFQVLSLPPEPVHQTRLLQNEEDMRREDPATIHQLVRQFKEGRT